MEPHFPSMEEEKMWDPASQSLAEALSLSLKVLKGIMVVLAILFLSSGLFIVNENEVAIVLVFGKVQQSGGEPVFRPGLHWTWPYPLSEVIKIPMTQQTLDINDFWYDDEFQKEKRNPPVTLNPAKDGYSLTSDANIVHSKWQVRYRIKFPHLYLGKSKESEKLLKKGKKETDVILRNIACTSIIEASTQFQAKDIIIRKEKEEMRRQVQEKMEARIKALNLGIQLEGVDLTEIAPPPQIKSSFELVSQAERERDQKIQEAEKKRTQILAEAETEARQIQKEAEDYGEETERETGGDSIYFGKVLENYKENPEIFWQKRYQTMLEEIPDKVQEIFLLRDFPRDLRIQINRNPDLYRIKPERKR